MRVLILSCFILCLSAKSAAWDFVVGANPQAPYKYLEDGIAKGIDVEVMTALLNELEVPFNFRFIDVDSRLQLEAKAGRVDMLLVYSENDARLKFLDFPNESYMNIDWHLFIRKSDLNRISYHKFSDLKPYKIGITQGVAYTEAFLNSGLQFDVAPSTVLQVKKLIAKHVDLAPMSTLTAIYEMPLKYKNRLTYLPKAIKSKPYFNPLSRHSTHPKTQVIKEHYDRIIRRMKQDGSIKAIYRKYLGPDFNVSF